MAGITNRKLTVGISGGLTVRYHRTDIPITQQGAAENFNYNELKKIFTHGSGTNKVNLLHFSTRNLVNAAEVIDLNGGLSNYWGDQLNFNAIKLLLIKNKETEYGRNLQVRFKNEIYYIGPGGSRQIIEPFGTGIVAILSSQSSEEGSLIFSTDNDVWYDLIVAGSLDESSSSSGA